MSRLVSIPTLAEETGIPIARLYALARDGLLPTVRLGRQVRVDRAHFEEWLASGGSALPGGWRREPSEPASTRP